MLEKRGLDGMQCQHWTLHVPEEYIAPGLEVGIVAGPGGLQIGGELIKWEELEVAKLRARGCEI